ncbi:MAG: hypothetical protein OHK0046_40560 [Anaerolineae bacterium]
MTEAQLNSKRWQDWTVLGVHFVILLGLSLATYVWRDLYIPGAIALSDIVLTSGIGVVAVGIMALVTIVVPLRRLEPLALSLSGMLLVALYTRLVSGEPVLMIGIMSAFVAVGLLRLGAAWGALHVIFLYVIATAVLVFQFGVDEFGNQAPAYAVPLVITLTLTALMGAWVYMRDEYDSSAQLNKLARASEKQLDDMRERARTISEMTNALIGTTKFDRILDAALDIGQISLRKNAKRRLVGLVMLFRSFDEMLYIANSRGVRIIDPDRIIPGKEGIVGQTLEECIPIIGTNPAEDPELRKLGIFKGIRSVLVIPLRAHYNNFGVLIFGSEEYNAFNEDHIDTLNAIGVQATVALQNAVLYKTLLEEKERIIEMEEDARKALVRDLHDIPTQTISAVAMRIRIIMRQLELDPKSVPEELQTVEQMALRATEEIRHVLFKLRPLVLESKGLAAALEELAEKMQKTYKQPMTVRVGGDVERYLDDNQQGALFYLVEEASNNARKYAEASMINVQIARQGEILVVRIADNGKGFDIEAAHANEKGSFGMINMRERAELLDGNLSIKSAKGEGTTITVVIPLDLSRKDKRRNGAKPDQVPTTKLAATAHSWLDGN